MALAFVMIATIFSRGANPFPIAAGRWLVPMSRLPALPWQFAAAPGTRQRTGGFTGFPFHRQRTTCGHFNAKYKYFATVIYEKSATAGIDHCLSESFAEILS